MCTISINDTCGKFAIDGNDAGGNLPPEPTETAANSPPLSTTPVANNGNNIRLLTLKVNLKEKIYLYANSTTQRCPKEIMKTFLI